MFKRTNYFNFIIKYKKGLQESNCLSNKTQYDLLQINRIASQLSPGILKANLRYQILNTYIENFKEKNYQKTIKF